MPPDSASAPPRVAVLAPVPVPYREPLFRMLSERERIDLRVAYLAAAHARLDEVARLLGRTDYRPDVYAGRQLA